MPIPSARPASRKRPRRSAAMAAAVRRAGQASKRVKTRSPSKSGALASSPIARRACASEAPRTARERAVTTIVIARRKTISRANARAYRLAARFITGSHIGLLVGLSTSLGGTKKGNAPGGYSTRKSRYGSSWPSIRDAYRWYTGISQAPALFLPDHASWKLPTSTTIPPAASRARARGEGVEHHVLVLITFDETRAEPAKSVTGRRGSCRRRGR